MSRPSLSLVVLTWNNLALSRRCLRSLKEHTSSPYELIVVDNGSEDGSRQFAIDEADIAVLHDDNPGFAVGMNAGLARASGDYIAFINNDTRFPEQWSEQILATAGSSQDMGIVLPAVTKAGNPVSVREHPGESIQRLTPFAEFPSGVVYVMRRQLIESLGGWNQAYVQASAEDLDLAFTVWAHGLNIFLDERVLVEHESQASVRHLEGRKALYRQNLEQFLDTWEDPTQHRRLLDTIDDEAFVHNLERAQTAAIWIRRTLEARDDANDLKLELLALSEVQTPARRWFRSRS